MPVIIAVPGKMVRVAILLDGHTGLFTVGKNVDPLLAAAKAATQTAAKNNQFWAN